MEELNPSQSAEENIRFLCFRKEGILFNEFDRIFSDLFTRRAPLYKKIVTLLAKEALTTEQILSSVKREKSGVFLGYLEDLATAGFISRDYTWKFNGEVSKLSQFRLSDNYLRFYLRYVEPHRRKILNDDMQDVSLSMLPYWSTVMGLQFENLILNNRGCIKQLLRISPEEIISDNPYFQRKTQRCLKTCQIDYLIHTRFGTLYLCEIKFSQKPIGFRVIQEVQEKIKILLRPKGFSVRPVLICEGEVTEEVVESRFFDKIIRFEDLLSIP